MLVFKKSVVAMWLSSGEGSLGEMYMESATTHGLLFPGTRDLKLSRTASTSAIVSCCTRRVLRTDARSCTARAFWQTAVHIINQGI